MSSATHPPGAYALNLCSVPSAIMCTTVLLDIQTSLGIRWGFIRTMSGTGIVEKVFVHLVWDAPMPKMPDELWGGRGEGVNVWGSEGGEWNLSVKE